jgi:hypothetical protein
MNEQNDYLEFTCKLDSENGDKLFVSDGSTVLFEVVNGEKSIGVGLNSQDVKQLIDYLNNCL